MKFVHYLVLAGNHQMFLDWCEQNPTMADTATFLDGPEDLVGKFGKSYRLIMADKAWEHPHIIEIMTGTIGRCFQE